MARLIVVFLLLWMAGLAQGASFVIGLAPIHSMRILAQRYEPLRAYLEAQLGRPVFVESAPDFAEFQARTLRGEFDLTLSPAHFARLAQKDKGFQPIVQFLPDHDAMLVYSVDRPLSSVGLLKNQPLAVIDRLTIGTMAALNYLEEHGLEAGRDYRVVEFHTHAGLGQSLANGTALAGVTTTPGLKQMPEAVRDKLRVFARIADIHGNGTERDIFGTRGAGDGGGRAHPRRPPGGGPDPGGAGRGGGGEPQRGGAVGDRPGRAGGREPGQGG